MFSFLNGKSPFDEAEERLERGENPREKKPQMPSMGWGDVVTLVVIVVLVVAGYKYYNYSKEESRVAFEKCAALYDESSNNPEMILQAEECYRGTMELGFVNAETDSIRGQRLAAVDALRGHQEDLLIQAREALADGDTAAALKVVADYDGVMFLDGKKKDEWDALAAKLPATVTMSPESEEAAAPAAPAEAKK